MLCKVQRKLKNAAKQNVQRSVLACNSLCFLRGCVTFFGEVTVGDTPFHISGSIPKQLTVNPSSKQLCVCIT